MPANSENLAEATGLEKASFHFNPKESESVKVKSLNRVRLHDPIDCSPPGSSIHGISQARVLEWAATAFSLLACEMSAIVQ